jgi:hypothetical protein
MVMFSHPTWRAAALATSLVAGLATVTASPAAAHPTSRDSARVVARGLDNPRQLTWSGGGLYVAESGVGGSGPCMPSPEGGEACYGASGAITRIKDGKQRRVVRHLPSIAGEGGNGAIGPSDVIVRGRHFTVALGLGANPAARDRLPARGKRLGTISTGHLGKSGLRVVADIARFEARANPDGGEHDTNPVGFVKSGRRHYHVADAGGNALLNARRHGRVRAEAVFPNQDVEAPPFLGLPPGATIPMQAVPTSVTYGPDRALYVSQLTGFPFPVGAASIWRVVPGKAPTRYATGLTNVTDLAFGRDGSLYVVQIADQGLLAGEEATGSVVRIPRGGGSSHETVIGGLKAPYGIALHKDAAYVTTCSTCADTGEVLRVPLHHTHS